MDTTLIGGGQSKGAGKFIQGGGASNYIVWVRNMGPLVINGK